MVLGIQFGDGLTLSEAITCESFGTLTTLILLILAEKKLLADFGDFRRMIFGIRNSVW